VASQYFKLFTDLLETWGCLTDEECGRLVRGLALYKRTGQPPDLPGNERFLFPVQKNQIDRDNDAYIKQCKANAANGSKGGRPKKATGFSETEKKRKNPFGFSETEKKRKNPFGFSETEKSQDKDKDKDKDKDNTPHTPQRGAEFDRFWSAYPKKVGKISAKKAFEHVIKTVPLESLLTAIERQKCGSQWSRDGGQYIPNPTTWLNQGRWEDEIQPITPNGPKGDDPFAGIEF
jgi:hypothetical protein